MSIREHNKLSTNTITNELLCDEECAQIHSTGEENSEKSVNRKHKRDLLCNDAESFNENKFKIPSFLLEKNDATHTESHLDYVARRQRKSKTEIDGRTFTCPICNKAYLSYPALYTHRRNKHNIIPITGKPELFKSNSLNSSTKFKYNTIETTSDVRSIVKIILNNYMDLCKKYFEQEDSILRREHNFEDDSFVKILKYYHDRAGEKTKIPKLNDKEGFIDNILIVYLILIIEVTREKCYSELIVKFVFLFREYLNIFGWDYKKYLFEYGLNDNFKMEGEFSQKNNCEEVPELVNDFISVFLELDASFTDSNLKDMTDICQNFCNWLVINELTCFKLSKIEA